MADETTPNAPRTSEGAAPEKPEQPHPSKPSVGGPPDKPEAPAAATKPASPAAAKPAAPAVPAKPAGPAPLPWESEMVTKLKREFGTGIKEALTYVGQPYLVVDATIAHDVLELLRDDEQFSYLVDCTAVHYPKRELQFDILWVLYSFARNERIRVKTLVKDGDPVPTVTDLWPTANWLERETFDMFGIRFEGHPGLKRILLPEEWKGHPLRKEYGILQQDTEWVKTNLGIESGQ